MAVLVVLALTVDKYSNEAGSSLNDFRDAGYYSVTAYLDGTNPYDVDEYLDTYPVYQEYPLLPPTYMLLHAPYQLADLDAASWINFGLTVAAMVVLSAWALHLAGYSQSLRLVFTIAGLMILSNPGRFNLQTGQATVVFVAAIYLALTAGSASTHRAGLATAAALTKPTFGLPVALFLGAMGRAGRAMYGLVVTAGVSAVLIVPPILSAGGLSPFTETLGDNLAMTSRSAGYSLETSLTRVDVASTVANVSGVIPPPWLQLVLTAGLTLVVALVLTRARLETGHDGTGDLAIVVISIATIVVVYHAGYDMLVLLLPILLVARRGTAGRLLGTWLRLVLLGALLLPVFNAFNTRWFKQADFAPERLKELLGPGLTGLSLLLALALALLAFHRATRAWTRRSGHLS